MPVDATQARELYREHRGGTPACIVRAPGRVNLIGEHTDYNDGFVLPMAIDRAVWIALTPRHDRKVVAYSCDFSQEAEFDLDAIEKSSVGWLEYIKGVASVLQEEGLSLQGWEGIVRGDVPVGAGLSSSAALEVATARAFAAIGDIEWDPVRMALLAQRAENRWVGVNCGIMDQLISAAGRENHALLIDCRSLDCRPVPLSPEVRVVILDTGTRRGLADSAYNERRDACEQAAAHFQVKALRDVSPETFAARASELDPVIRRRARHVISENDRTLQAVAAMEAGDMATLGRLMYESHVSLRDDYEVSSDALNAMVEIARKQAACIGARMTGAGFGGCAVALVEAAGADDFAETVATAYRQETGNEPAVYVCRATAGADVVTD
ncbi:galactokinase [Thermostilla marina]